MLQNLINPCHECNHHLNGGSKDDPRCEECQKRVDYVESLGSLSESVPDDVILNGGAIVDIDEQIKIYIEKLCEEAGVWSDYLTDPEIKHDRIASPIRTKVIDKFKDIHPKILSKHLGISQSAIYQRTTRTNPKKKDATKPIKTITKKEPEHGLHIYLPEKIYNILVLTAKAKLRTLENQAIFIIEKYIKKNETKNCS